METLPKKIDFEYIFSRSDSTKYEIPQYYDKQSWNIGETYRIRVGHVYDPSKFWVVVKAHELDIFQVFLKDFYDKYGTYFKMSENTLCRNTYCVAVIEDAFYRGIIINIPHSSTVETKAFIFLFDFGYVTAISLDKLYYFHEKLFDVPQFSVRALLSHIQPYHKHEWDNNVVRRFNELVSGKNLLCMLECTDPSRRIIGIAIGDVKDSSVIDIGEVLMKEKLARRIHSKTNIEKHEKRKGRYLSKSQYPYLFPSFEAIESGRMPSSVYISEMLWQSTGRDVLFRPYFAGIKE